MRCDLLNNKRFSYFIAVCVKMLTFEVSDLFFFTYNVYQIQNCIKYCLCQLYFISCNCMCQLKLHIFLYVNVKLLIDFFEKVLIGTALSTTSSIFFFIGENKSVLVI